MSRNINPTVALDLMRAVLALLPYAESRAEDLEEQGCGSQARAAIDSATEALHAAGLTSEDIALMRIPFLDV